MNLTRDMVVAAVDAGLALTDPEQELLNVFRKHNQGLTILRAILENISTGNIVLSSPKPPEQPPADGIPEHVKAALAKKAQEGEPEGELEGEDLKPGGTNPDDD